MKETIGGEFRLLMRTNDGFFFGRIFQSMAFVTTICYSHSRRGICLTVYVSFFSITKKKKIRRLDVAITGMLGLL